MADNPAYIKAEEVLLLRDELRDDPDLANLTEAELFAQAEKEYDCCEEALSLAPDRYLPARHVECRPLLGGFEMIQGSNRIQIQAHQVDQILDTMRRAKAEDNRAKRNPTFEVIAGRKVGRKVA